MNNLLIDTIENDLKKEFNKNPLIINEQFSSPRIITFELNDLTTIDIQCLSNGKYLYNNSIYKNKMRSGKGGQKALYEQIIKDFSKNKIDKSKFNNTIPDTEIFKIDAGYKFLGRQDLKDNDLCKKTGSRIETIFKTSLQKIPGWKPLFIKLSHQADLLLINENNKIIVYFEVKMCPVLDTTNGPGNLDKISSLTDELNILYGNQYNIITGLFSPSVRNDEPFKEFASRVVAKRPQYSNYCITGLNTVLKIFEQKQFDNDQDFVNYGIQLGKHISY